MVRFDHVFELLLIVLWYFQHAFFFVFSVVRTIVSSGKLTLGS